MAWLHNLAGRAEELLNKIDQNAASVLNETNSNSFHSTEQDQNKPNETYFKMGTNEEAKITEDNESANSFSKSLDFQRIPSKELLLEENTNNDSIDHTNPKTKSESFTTIGDNSKDDNNLSRTNSISDKMSPTASMSNSFILAEECLEDKITKLELKNEDLNKQLLNMRHMYSELRNENANLKIQVDRANEEVITAQQEKKQYIARAQRILSEKEKLISLKNENNLKDETDSFLNSYNTELVKELKLLQDRNCDLEKSNENLAEHIKSLQMHQQLVQNDLLESIKSLEETLANEKKYREIAEEECEQKTKDLHAKNQEIIQYQQLVNSKTLELQQMQTWKQNWGMKNDDKESRIKILTQTLIEKQNCLETVNTERNALMFQLEKLESDHKSNLAVLKNAQVKVVNIQQNDDFTQSNLRISRLSSPFNTAMVRRVKHAYSSLDAVSIRMGTFLRRYPFARVAVFYYIVLLHIWMVIVLFWYAPTIR